MTIQSFFKFIHHNDILLIQRVYNEDMASKITDANVASKKKGAGGGGAL